MVYWDNYVIELSSEVTMIMEYAFNTLFWRKLAQFLQKDITVGVIIALARLLQP